MTSTIAGVPVPDGHWPSWRDWFAPERQPFDVSDLPDDIRAALPGPEPVRSPEIRDTFYCYHRNFVQLDAAEFGALSQPVRAALARTRVHPGRPHGQSEAVRRLAREQTGGGSFVWWPGLLELAGDEPIVEFVGHGLWPSLHREVPGETWRRLSGLLPGAEELAGSFPDRSGPNCFETVLAAAGVQVEDGWVQQDTFEAGWTVQPRDCSGGHRTTSPVWFWCGATSPASRSTPRSRSGTDSP